MTVVKFKFEENFGYQKAGNNLHGHYVYHNITQVHEIILGDETSLDLVYSTGMYVDYDDYDCPSNDFSFDDTNSADVLVLIEKLGQIFDEESKYALEQLEDIKELCSFIDSFDKIREIYACITDNVPNFNFEYDLSEDLDDYVEDEDGILTLKTR